MFQIQWPSQLITETLDLDCFGALTSIYLLVSPKLNFPLYFRLMKNMLPIFRKLEKIASKIWKKNWDRFQFSKDLLRKAVAYMCKQLQIGGESFISWRKPYRIDRLLQKRKILVSSLKMRWRVDVWKKMTGLLFTSG